MTYASLFGMTQPLAITVPESMFAAAGLETVADAMRIGTLPVMHEAVLYRHDVPAKELLTLADRFDRPIEWQGETGTEQHIPKVSLSTVAALTDEIKIRYVLFGLHADVDDERFNEHNDTCLTAPDAQHGSSDPDYPSDPAPAPAPKES